MAQSKNITAKEVLDLVRRQGYVCAISGRTLTPETASLDHTVPLGRGGEHSIRNISVVDHQVNIAKGTMTTDEFVVMCKEVAAYQGRQGESPVCETQEASSEGGLGPPTPTLF